MKVEKKKIYQSAPLPFMGQKRMFIKEFRNVLKEFPDDAVYVDLFGGSGLLAHISKQEKSEARVVYNDFDNYRQRLENVGRTNALLAELREMVKDYPRGKLLPKELHERIIQRLEAKEVTGFVDYITLSSSLIEKINRERRNSKNYVLFLGSTDAETNQAPCLSLVQFQIDNGELVVSAYQRSSDANLGLPSDIYHLYLMARQIDLPLKRITLTFGNVHIYDNNVEGTRKLLDGEEGIRFELNV